MAVLRDPRCRVVEGEREGGCEAEPWLRWRHGHDPFTSGGWGSGCADPMETPRGPPPCASFHDDPAASSAATMELPARSGAPAAPNRALRQARMQQSCGCLPLPSPCPSSRSRRSWRLLSRSRTVEVAVVGTLLRLASIPTTPLLLPCSIPTTRGRKLRRETRNRLRTTAGSPPLLRVLCV
jgi:hypothetical protein